MEMQQPHKSDATAAWRSAGPSKWQRAQEIRRGTMSSCTRRVWETRHPGVLGECLRERKHSGLHALCCIACKWAKTRILACCPSTRAPLSNERKHLVQSHKPSLSTGHQRHQKPCTSPRQQLAKHPILAVVTLASRWRFLVACHYRLSALSLQGSTHHHKRRPDARIFILFLH
jgi:hypothetical protein